MESIPKIFFLIIFCLKIKINWAENGLITVFEEKLQNKLSEYTNYIAKWLEEYNDRHIGNSEIGKMLGYDVLKPELGTTARESKSMKKMSMALIPLIFHVGATSTFMLLTSIMAVKSVTIGLVLLVFKIAVSSAKMASFFTSFKAKQNNQHDWSWSPHFEHHGHVRSLTDEGSQVPSSWNSYAPQAHDVSGPSYKAMPTQVERYEELGYKTNLKKRQISHS